MGHIITLVMMDDRCVIFIFHVAHGLSRQVSHSLLARSRQLSLSTYFKHSDLRCSQLRSPTTGSSFLPNVPPSNNQRPPTKPDADKPCRQWNYYGSCSCDKANLESFNGAFHKCRVCAKDLPMLHCPKRRNPISPPTSW